MSKRLFVADADGFGAAAETTEACSAPDGYVDDNTDCDDEDDAVYPGAPELCDGKDNDCDGETPVGEVDLDEDGVLDCLEVAPVADG